MRFILTMLAAAVVCLAALAGLAGCGGGASASGKETVVAGFYPLAFAAQRIGGDAVTVANLTPAGAEPHDLEVSPSDVARLQDADLVLLLGRGFQPQLEDAAGSGDNVLALLDTPGLGVHADDDPHVWLDPIRYARIVERVGRALGRPAATRRLVSQLHGLDHAYRSGLAHCARRDVVTSHEAFAYLAERYGLRQIALTGLNPEAEPTPQALARTIEAVRTSGATTVYFERLVSPKLAETIARETGTSTAVLDPIEGLTEDEAAHGDTYFTLMRTNLAALRKGLGCR